MAKIGCMDTKGKNCKAGYVIVHRHYTTWANMRRGRTAMRNTNKYRYFMDYLDTRGPSLVAYRKETK